MHERPIVFWHRMAPEGFVPPAKFADCTVNAVTYVLENGKRSGQEAIRLDCLQEEETVLLDIKTKRVIWREYWGRS